MNIAAHIRVLMLVATALALPAAAADAPQPPISSMAFAAAAARSDQSKLAAKLYREQTKQNPRDAAAWFGLGQALEADNHLGEAVAALERATELQPGLPGLSRARGRAELRAGNLAAAESAYRSAAAEIPNDPRAWVGLGVALDLQRRHGEAQAAYTSALRADPLDRPARNNMALSVALQGDSARAAQLLEPWANTDDAPARMRGNLQLLQAAATPSKTIPAGVDPQFVAALRAFGKDARP